VDVQNQQLEIQKQITESRRTARNAAAFKRLGLTAEGDKPTPGGPALLKRALGLQRQIKGTILDTPKTRGILKKIIAELKRNLKGASQAVRAAILEMLNDISGAFDEGAKKGPLTSTHGLATAQIIKNLGLSPEQADEIQRRLAHATTPGRRATNAPGASGGPDRRRGRGGEGFFVESHTTINLDGHQVANVVTRQQQKAKRRNPKQKRGPHRN